MCKIRIVCIVLLSLLAFGRISAAALADQTRFDVATYKAGLRTTSIEDNGFIEHTLFLVGQGLVPADMFDSTFQWARKKPYKHRFQYFKQALIVRADRIGIHIDP